MQAAVIGLGSMGQRRIRLIKQYARQNETAIEIYGIDLSQERRKNCEAEWQIKTFGSLGEACDAAALDCIFISPSPLSHAAIIRDALSHGLHVFTELNLVSDGYDANIALSAKNQCVLFLSSTFLYREEIHKIREEVGKTDKPLRYSYHVGQYLPDWHPWENYQDFFVANRRTNGCRELFAIELPWLTNIFGAIESFEVQKSKMTGLAIDYADNYQVLIKHTSGHQGLLAIDVVSRKAVRNLEIYGEDSYIEWNGQPDGLSIFQEKTQKVEPVLLYDHIDQLENYSSFVVENAYYHEIEAFFQEMNGEQVALYGFEQDKIILGLIDQIEA